MRKLGVTIGALALAAVLAGPAAAADAYSSGGLKDGGGIVGGPAPYSWSGFYIGGQIGGAFVNHDVSYASGGFNADFNGVSAQGFMGGGIIGADTQIGNAIVAGVFGRIDFSTAETTLSIASREAKDTLNFMWTVGGRAGVLVGPSKSTLIYGLIGYSQAELEFNGGTLVTRGGIAYDWKRTPGGITAGGGIETALGGNFFAKLEYDWTGLDSVSQPDIKGLSIASDIQRVTAGVTYKIPVGQALLK